jgi:hypothetical protein
MAHSWLALFASTTVRVTGCSVMLSIRFPFMYIRGFISLARRR